MGYSVQAPAELWKLDKVSYEIHRCLFTLPYPDADFTGWGGGTPTNSLNGPCISAEEAFADALVALLNV